MTLNSVNLRIQHELKRKWRQGFFAGWLVGWSSGIASAAFIVWAVVFHA